MPTNEDIYQAVLHDEDDLAHYGRIGMKWYQHIYGEYQGAAKYAEKGARKLEASKQKDNFRGGGLSKRTQKLTTAVAAVNKAKQTAKKKSAELTKGYLEDIKDKDKDINELIYGVGLMKKRLTNEDFDKLSKALSKRLLDEKSKDTKNDLDINKGFPWSKKSPEQLEKLAKKEKEKAKAAEEKEKNQAKEAHEQLISDLAKGKADWRNASSKDLQEAIARLTLEKQYKELRDDVSGAKALKQLGFNTADSVAKKAGDIVNGIISKSMNTWEEKQKFELQKEKNTYNDKRKNESDKKTAKEKAEEDKKANKSAADSRQRILDLASGKNDSSKASTDEIKSATERPKALNELNTLRRTTEKETADRRANYRNATQSDKEKADDRAKASKKGKELLADFLKKKKKK